MQGEYASQYALQLGDLGLGLLDTIDLRTHLRVPPSSPSEPDAAADAAEYDAKFHLLKAIPPGEQFIISQITISQSDVRDVLARTVLDLLVEREDEHHDDLLRVHMLTTPVATYQPAAPSTDDAGYWDQRLALPTSLKRAASETQATPESPPTQFGASSANLLPLSLVTATLAAAKSGGTPANPLALEVASMDQRSFGSSLADILASSEILHVLPLAELSPVDFADLGAATRSFLSHLEELGLDLDLYTPGSWGGYVWLAASIALAGRMAHRAIVVRSRRRMSPSFKGGWFEMESTNEDHRG
jgi:hypothetical protein